MNCTSVVEKGAMRPAVDAIIHERVIVCACKVTRPTQWRRRRRQRICNFAHSLGNRTPVVEVYAWWFPMLSLRRGKKSASRLVAGPRGDRKRHGTSERGADYGRSFPTLCWSLLDSTCSQKYRLEEDRRRGE